MQRLPTLCVLLILTCTALSGCSSKGDGDDHHGEDLGAMAGTGYDRAVGNNGYRVTGSFTGAAAALEGGSAIQIDVLDIATDDSGGALDKASLILDARQTGHNVIAGLRSMATKAAAASTADHFGGVGRNVDVFGSTGVGPSDLPAVKAFLFVTGLANVKIAEKTYSSRLVYIALVPAIRDHHDQTPLSAPDGDNAQIHIIFPGANAGGANFEGVPDGFLYYYFETVGISKLSDTEKADIGKNLAKPDAANKLPVASGKIFVGDKVATSAMKEDTKNVTVTFDGTDSSDEDGAISRWVWRLGERTVNNTYERPKEDEAVVQGEKVEYTFTSPGAKLINLTVVDTAGGSSSLDLYFYINFHRIQVGGGSYQSQVPGGGPQCLEAQNCFSNQSRILPGLVSATYKAIKANGATISGFHVDFFSPGQDKAGDTPLKAGPKDAANVVTAADTKGVPGVYTLWVWYEAGSLPGGRDMNAQTTDSIYDLESTIIYAPTLT